MTQIIEVGDYVEDPSDGMLHKVARVTEDTAYLESGGCLMLDEIGEVYLPGEIGGVY